MGWTPCRVKIPCRRACVTLTTRVLHSNAANTDNARFASKVNFAPGKIPLGARPPENVYSVPAKETAKHYAKFG